MGKKWFLLFPFIILSLLVTQCSKTKVDPYQNTLKADQIIMNGGLNNSNTRGQAQSLYADALNNLGKGDPNYAFIYSHANFGLGMIGIWNALDTVSSLLSSTNLLGGSSSGSCQPIDLSAYQTLLGPVLDNMISPIVAHFQAVTQFTGFSFTINSATLVIFNDMKALSSSLAGQSFTLDMSGAYDLGEVDIMLSLFETLQGGVKLLFAYNGVLNAIANLLVGLTQTGCTMPNPLLDPNFGTLTSNGAQMLSDAQYLLADAAKNFSNAMNVVMGRKGDSSNHVFLNYYDYGTCPNWLPQCSPTTVISYVTSGLGITFSVPHYSIPRTQFANFTTDTSKWKLDPAGDDDPQYSNPWGSTGQFTCKTNCTENDHIAESQELALWTANNPPAPPGTNIVGPQDTGYDGLFDYQEPGYDPSCNPDPKLFDAFPPNLPWLAYASSTGKVPFMTNPVITSTAMASGLGQYWVGKPFSDWGTDELVDQLENGYVGPDPKADLYDPRYNPTGEEDNGHYDQGEPWGSEIIGQLLVVVLKLLPQLSPSLGSSLNNILVLLPKDQKTAGEMINNYLFVQGLPMAIPISGINLQIPPISKLIYLTDLKAVADALYASITDTNGQHPLDIMPGVAVLVPRLLPMLNINASGTLGGLLSGIISILRIALNSTGGAYTILPTLPSIDLGAFLSNPPTDLKTLAPLYYQTSNPLIGTNTYTAPEPFADGFVHVPASEDPNGAGYWTSTASFVYGTNGTASGPGNVISGTVNGTCDAVTIITDSTTGTPLTYTITGSCTGDPTSKDYSGEWYADSGDHIWHSGTPVCNSTQSNQPCFVNIYGDGLYHKAGDIVMQYDEEQQFPLQTQPFTGLSWSGVTVTAYSDTGTDRVPDNLELGYNLVNNPDPYGDDISCTTAYPNLKPWPLPSTPDPGDALCGEKDGRFDGWDGNLLDLIYLGVPNSLISMLNGSLGLGLTCNSPSCLLPLGSLLAIFSPGGPPPNPFMPRYHFWPVGFANSGLVDVPDPLTISLPGALLGSLLPGIQGMLTLDVMLPNNAYMFFPDPSFGGLLTVGRFNWGPQYSQWLGIANTGAPCGTISYSTSMMTNAQMNQYANIVNLLIGILNGTIKLNLSGISL